MITIFTFFLLCFCSSCVCLGAYIAMQKDMVLDWFYEFIKGLPSCIYQPLGGCLYCMASAWGILAYLLFRYLFVIDISILSCIPAVFVICFINFYIWALIPDEK